MTETDWGVAGWPGPGEREVYAVNSRGIPKPLPGTLLNCTSSLSRPSTNGGSCSSLTHGPGEYVL